MNGVTVKNLNSCYSEIMVTYKKKTYLASGGETEHITHIKKHIVSNNGWFDLDYWINHFKKE